MGEIQENVLNYLEGQGIKLGQSDIELTWGKIEHIFREDKKTIQKVTPTQAKRVVDIISKNNVYYDSRAKNIIYISKLPPKETQENRNWIKIPILFHYKGEKNIVGTMSIIPSTVITDSPKIYKRID